MSQPTRRHRTIARVGDAVRRTVRQAVAAALVVFPAALVAADPAKPPEPADGPVFSTELVKAGLYRISGGGGTSLVRSSSTGWIVVDSKRAGTYEPLMAEIRRIARSLSPPTRALIL